MAPPNTPETKTPEQKRDGELRALFEKARTHKNFQDARKSAQEITTVTLLGESDEEQQVEIIFKEHYASAKYTTDKEKPAIEEGKTHMLLGNVDSDAFDSNYNYGPDYYQNLKLNAMLFFELKDYIDINFPPLKDPTKKARMLEMIEKTRFLGNALNIKSFKEFCTQKSFTKAEVFGKHGLLQVLLAFSRAIEPVTNRDLLKVENFKITEKNPNPLFYRIELGVGNTGKNKKDRFSIVLKTTLSGKTVEPEEEPEESNPDDEGKGTYIPGDVEKIQPPPSDDDEEEPEEPAAPTEPTQPPATPPEKPAEPAEPPTAPAAPPDAPDAAPPAQPPAAPPVAPPAAPPAVLTLQQLDIKIDNENKKLDINTPEGFTFELTETQEPKGYLIKVSLPDKDTPEDPTKAKTGIIALGKNLDYKANTPDNGPQFWYNFSNTPGTASNLDIWKFYKLQTDPAKPSITISKLETQIAIPSINYDEAEKTITVFPVADIGKRKLYKIDDQSGQSLKFTYFNEDGVQRFHVTTQDGSKKGDITVEEDQGKPNIPLTWAADYSTDIFQHYDFTFTEGQGNNKGTLQITPASIEIKETTLKREIAPNSSNPDEKMDFNITVKAPGNQTIEIEKTEENNYYKVQFGGLTGYFQIEKNDDNTYRLDYSNTHIDGENLPSRQDLWSNYKATLDFKEKTITIEKLEKKPLPRLQYDEETGTVTFFEDNNDTEKATPYKINKPTDVEIQYKHENNNGGETFELGFWKDAANIYLDPDKTFSNFSNSVDNLWTTHNISFNEESDPKTLTITEINDTVHPDAPRILFDSTKYDKATGKGTFEVRFTDGTKKEYNLALPPNTTIFYAFSNGQCDLTLDNETVFKKEGEAQKNLEITFKESNQTPQVDQSVLNDTYGYNFNPDTKTITITEKIKAATPPAPPPAPPAPPPAPPAPTTDTYSKLGTATTPAPAAPVGPAPTAAPSAAPATAKKPPTISSITLPDANGKITVTLENKHTQDFTLILPEKYKDKIGFEIKTNPNDNNKPYLAVYWDDNDTQYQGYIQLPDNIPIRSIKYDNWQNTGSNIKPFFSKLDLKGAPFSLEFESGKDKTPPTITLTSNKEVEALEKAKIEAQEKIKQINSKLGENLYYHTKPFRSLHLDIRINDLNKYEPYEPTDSEEINAINDLKFNESDISTAVKALPDWQQEALDKIFIKVGKETATITNDKPVATIAYDKLGNQADIMDELKKIISFYFHTWDTTDAENLKLEKIKAFKPETIGEKYGNFYSSSKFKSGRLNEYKPEEGDYKAFIGYTYMARRKIYSLYKFEKNRWKEVIGKDASGPEQQGEIEF